jgi:high frequency lysogenization protein
MKDRVIALAALVQAVEQVQQMANLGQAQTRALEPVIASLFRFDASSTEDIYSGARNLDSGIKRLRAQLDGAGRDSFIVRVCTSLLQLEPRWPKKKATHIPNFLPRWVKFMPT